MSTEKLFINILTSKTSWMSDYDKLLKNKLEALGHTVNLINSKNDLQKADISFFLSCFEIIDEEYLKKSSNNIVVHASDLPKGKGWSPASWQILEGASEIVLSLFEATASVDSGVIYLKDKFTLDGTELIDKWQMIMGSKIVKMCENFVLDYPNILSKGKAQIGDEFFYQRRTPKDSELDINKSIKEQFNLLRIVDNEKYPAFFFKDGKKYILKIFEDSDN